MITALKKKFATNNGLAGGLGDPSPVRSRVPSGVSIVDAKLQKKFAHGVNFNMKIIIRGDRNSGKTSLWKRLQGMPFDERYLPTEEIQVCWRMVKDDHSIGCQHNVELPQ
jgi:hypothetical protein